MKRKLSILPVPLLGGDCGGITASESISTLDFILPGLMQSEPPAPVISSATNGPPEVAQAKPDLLSMQTQTNSSL